MNGAAFLDRDGVLVESFVRDGAPFAATTLEEFQIVEGAGAQVNRLKAAGLLCILFTNQPEVARGTIAPATLDAMHQRLQEEVRLDAIYVCAHEDADGCDCRKPKPGMLLTARDEHDIDLRRSFVVGDRWRDVEAGRLAGCATVLIEREYSACSTADVNVRTLAEAVDAVLRLAEESCARPGKR